MYVNKRIFCKVPQKICSNRLPENQSGNRPSEIIEWYQIRYY